jgi:tRNA threonylcarbamoyladenosine biosynthesis protein TsaB
MKILALDSSAIAASVALCDGDRLLAEYTLNNGNTHSETLLPMVEALLSKFNMTANDVELFAASAGPGSFTGVRIGAATLKGLAFGKDKPCVEVSTLEALAHNLVMQKGLVCPVMNARRSQVYTALFRSDGQTLTRLLPDSAMAISELDELLSKYGETVAFCGDGYAVTLDALEKTVAAYVPDRLRHQSAYSVAVVAYRQFTEKKFVSDEKFKVTYLRPSQAEREMLEKNKLKKEENK